MGHVVQYKGEPSILFSGQFDMIGCHLLNRLGNPTLLLHMLEFVICTVRLTC
jgi:hypothetical protein